MFDRFKVLSRMLCFIFLFNFMILNFGMKPKEVRASIIDINSIRAIDYNLRVDSNYVVFDFSSYLSGNEKIESFVLKKGNDTIASEAFSDEKKAWKSRFIPINGEKYDIQAEINLGEYKRKLSYSFIYIDHDIVFKPIGAVRGNNVEFDMKSWASKFTDDLQLEVDVLMTNGVVAIPAAKTTIKQLKAAALLFSDKKASLSAGGYIVRAKLNGREYKSKFYYDGTYIKNLNVELSSATINENGTMNIDIKSDIGLASSTSDSFRMYSNGVTYTGTPKGNNIFGFENVVSSLDMDYHVRIDSSSSSKFREAMFSLGRISKFNKLGYNINIVNDSTINLVFSDVSHFFSVTSNKNKVYLYELNDTFEKGNKIGSKESNLSATSVNTINLNDGVRFSKDKSYLVELTNGDHTISSSFIYVPMNLLASEIKGTSAKLTWDYPSGYTPVSGDKLEIYLRDKSQSGEYSAIPKSAFVHGSGGVNLSNLKSTVINGISPGTNYEVKFILNNQRGSVVSYTEFTTEEFRLKDFIQVKDSIYRDAYYKEAWPRSRNVTIEWDFEPADMEFSPGDKVEIFLKPNGNAAFSGYPNNEYYKNPAFSATTNLNSVKSANIQIPTWMSNIHVDLIYTIGGKQILTPKPQGSEGENCYNRRTVYPKVNNPVVAFSDITETTAKITWDYDHGFSNDYKQYEPENGHIVKLHLKKTNTLNDGTTSGFMSDEESAVFYYEHGRDGVNILDKKEFTVTGLEPDQTYRARIEHILQSPGFDNRYRALSNYYNFKTRAFAVTNLTATQEGETPKVKLTWDTEGSVEFSEADNIKIYLKENTTSEYPQEPVLTSKNMSLKTETIDMPKYNTTYNVKVEYEIRGKKVSEYVLAEATGDVDVSITDIKNTGSHRTGEWSAKIKWEYPKDYDTSKRKDDKIKLTVNKRNENGQRTNSLPQEQEIDVTTKEKELTNLEANATYDVKVSFMNHGSEVYVVNTSFKATNDLQVVGLVATDIKSKTATLKWDYTPTDKNFGSGDKVEVYIKENKKSKASDDLSDYKKIYTLTNNSVETRNSDEIQVLSDGDTHSKHVATSGDMKKFKSLNLKDLGVNKDYSIKVQYTVQEDAAAVETLTEAQQEAKEPAYAEVSFKTIADSFKATVFVSNQTTATYGWDYPAGYVIQEGDKVEIFVKQVKEEGKSNVGTDYGDSLLTLVHGDEYDLNEIKRVDISGLTPEAKYKSKIQFTMGTDSNATAISQEIDISTKSFEIKSFEVDSYQEYDILVKWEIEPENMVFNEADTAEIFVKLATDEEYPNDPSYKLTSDGDNNISNTFSDYVLAETIGAEQNMKLVYTVGDRKYSKELTFTNSIDPIKASVFSVDETRALIQIEAPQNYEFVNGDRLLIYSKDEFAGNGEIESDDFLVFEGVQADNLSIPDDMKLIELSYLLPEAKYEVLVALDLLDGKVAPVKLEFTTEGLPVSDIKLEAIRYDDSVISWNYGDNVVDFYKDEDYNYTDKLIIAHKESDGTPIPEDLNAIKQLKNVEYLGGEIKDVKDASIQVEDVSKDYDVVVCYDLGGLLYTKNFKASYLSVSVDEGSVISSGAKISWKYPSNIEFGEGDKTEIFIRKKQDSSYPESPVSTSTASSTTSYSLENLEGSTEYVVKVQISKEGVQIDPVEVEFTTLATPSSEVIVEQIDYEIVGMAAQFAIPNAENIVIDKNKPIGLRMGNEPYQGFTVKLDENGTSFTIEPTIPKKKYENIEVEIPLEDGTVFKMTIKEFTTQPQDIAQDWISNAYWFAFERFPDEEGYNYWYEHRMLAKTLNGEYFLKNLMFAEDEFTNRNLQDRDLIAALYQIVVNREYDEEGLNFWVGIYNENLQNASGDKKLAQEVLVDRMVHEPEFGGLCEKIGIFWRQSDQDAAGVVSP